MPLVLQGTRILDLGSGSGRDCFILSKLVGENGFVMGVDMTEEQVQIASKYIPYHQQKFGYAKPNVEFKKGYIEKLNELNIADNSFDIIISNCVVNLSPDKESVLREAFRVLKEGGEMYFSDVYSDRRIPKELAADEVLYGECISGALYWNDFINLAKKVGFKDPRLVSDAPITIRNPEIEKKVGNIQFFSATYRLFKLPSLEPACEDYGEAVQYIGNLSEDTKGEFVLDNHHIFPKGKVIPVCGNTYDMLKKTRFASYFNFFGDRSTHYGIFQGCGTDLPFSSSNENKATSSKSSCC